MTISEILEKLPKVKEDRGYWLVRTKGGLYYESFFDGEFIAVGWEKIKLSDVAKGKTDNKTGFQILREIISKHYPDESRPGYAANQLLKFAYDIKKNDIVLIPSENSDIIAFGEVVETPSYSDIYSNDKCAFSKRKKVRWLKTIGRNKLDPHLYKLMFSHLAISDASGYAEQIDKEISSFFVKGGKAHLVLEVQAEEDIPAKNLFEFGLYSLDILDEFCKVESLKIKSDEFNVKLDVQSPGFIEISGMDISGIVLLGLIIVSIAGGGASLKMKNVNFGINTDGIIEKIGGFLRVNSNIKAKKKLLENHTKNLDIKDPEELIKLFKELNKK
ncbi:hypothetical protein FKX85_06700 [Echinicola soli]|uniref:Uncharacterized protein n=1 Tax=Echinicola soli TaxID=2591634 RepID=A0A514CFZ4_9BACT|nr:hypothetical protein [Echinicola soli]QDH78741.1 hypothetical protein FKX85_06700 [Echinicola soli]